MKVLIVALGPLLIAASPAQPDLSKWSAWAPKGWRTIRAAEGNLTGVGSSAVVVIEQTNPTNLHKNDGLGVKVLNLNPRRLLLLAKIPGGYRELSRADYFIPSESDAESACQSDPLAEDGKIGIAQGAAIVRLYYWQSCGGWGVTTNTYRFRLEGKRLRLTGLDHDQAARNSGEESIASTNFLTGQQKLTTGLSAVEDPGVERPKPKIKWKPIPRTPPFYMDAMRIARCSEGETQPIWCGGSD
jgi:hypothetical protein